MCSDRVLELLSSSPAAAMGGPAVTAAAAERERERERVGFCVKRLKPYY